MVTKTGDLITLDVRTRADWRRWLAKHHASTPGIWLLRHKQHTGVKSMPYEDLIREALCFGWVDSLIKRVDDNRYAIKVTARQPTSKWSDINRRRWKQLKAAGLLAAPGLAAAPTGNSYAPHPPIPELPAYVAKALKTNRRAWQHFQALAPTYRRDFVVWIHTAKRAGTRERRIRESIELLSAGKKLGLR
ncbi:MAG TPA: YdeI/OmpD-associated family protein [Gemmatimonadales bacterium]|nr:YdeI/OmpD-associated family protein [Gemmatimonadales bacterium]